MTSDAPARSPSRRCATSFTLVRTAAGARSSRGALRGVVEERGFQSWSTQVCGPGAAERATASSTPSRCRGRGRRPAHATSAPPCSRASRSRRASASSRSVSHSTETGMTSLIAHPPASGDPVGGVAPAREARPAAPRLVGQPRAQRRDPPSIAAAPRRARAARSGGTRTAAPLDATVCGIPPTSLATTGMPRRSASAMAMP